MASESLPTGAVEGSTAPDGNSHLPSSLATAHSALARRLTRSMTRAAAGVAGAFAASAMAVINLCSSESGSASAAALTAFSPSSLRNRALLRPRAATQMLWETHESQSVRQHVGLRKGNDLPASFHTCSWKSAMA